MQSLDQTGAGSRRLRWKGRAQRAPRGRTPNTWQQYTSAVPLLLALATLSPPALAQSLDCDDIEFEPSVVERFPSVAQSCHSVVTRNGKLYVRLVADVIRAGHGTITLYLKGPDGSRVRQEWTPPDGFQPTIGGQPTPLRELRRGQEIRIYLPEADWHVADATGADPS